jgi:hypothetical protein
MTSLEQTKTGFVGMSALSADAPQNPAFSFSIGSIRPASGLTQIRKAWIDRIDREKESVLVEVYPSGVEITTGKEPGNRPVQGVTRGVIEGFSDKSKRRLREAFLTLYVSGFALSAVTLTTRANFSREAYRGALDRLAQRMKVLGWSALIRHELQRRGAPHSHLALWHPPGVTRDEVSRLWLECTGEIRDAAARRHAVVMREIKHDEAGWIVYMAKHDSKEDEVQSAWGGKHWSIWNRAVMQKRTPDKFTLSTREHAQLLRLLLRHQQALRRQDVAKLLADFRGVQASVGGVVASRFETNGDGVWSVFGAAGEYLGETCDPHGKILGAEEKSAWLRLKRCRVKIHRGDLLRLLKGETVARMVRGIQSGSIYGVRLGDPF